MFQRTTRQYGFASAFAFAELVFHVTVRKARGGNLNAVIGLVKTVGMNVMMIFVFLAIMEIAGMRRAAIRGDFVLYLMSGIFLYMTHIRGLKAVASAEGPTSSMMQHEPMTTSVSIIAGAIAALYMQTLAMFIILALYHVAWAPIHIVDPVMAFAMFLLAWFSGCCIGMVFLAAKPWIPATVGIATMVYTRANMLASGKMFLANSLPAFTLPFFTWNPLFHCIDQARGFTFANYFPHHTNMTYPVVLSVIIMVIGMMGEFVTRRHASASWWARRS